MHRIHQPSVYLFHFLILNDWLLIEMEHVKIDIVHIIRLELTQIIRDVILHKLFYLISGSNLSFLQILQKPAELCISMNIVSKKQGTFGTISIVVLRSINILFSTSTTTITTQITQLEFFSKLVGIKLVIVIEICQSEPRMLTFVQWANVICAYRKESMSNCVPKVLQPDFNGDIIWTSELFIIDVIENTEITLICLRADVNCLYVFKLVIIEDDFGFYNKVLLVGWWEDVVSDSERNGLEVVETDTKGRCLFEG